MQRPNFENLLTAAHRIGSLLLFAAAPATAVALTIGLTIGGPHPFFDFDGTLWQAGKLILDGHNPYPAGFLHRLAEITRAGGSPSLVYAVPLYPAPALLAFVPLSLLPLRVAGLIFALGSIAALVAGLRLLGVRDARCYGAALLSWPTLQAIRLGALDPLLLLGVAGVWRSRRGPALSGAIIAATAMAKLFLWPVGVLLVITRRWRTVAVALAIAVLGSLAGWAVISFAGLGSYLGMLSDVSTVESAGGSSIIAAGVAAGLPASLAHLLSLALAAGIIAAAGWVGWRQRDEARALGLLVMAALVGSPVVWPHYLVLAYVPIALLRPRFSPLWLLPLLSYLAPVELTHGDLWLIAPYLIVEAVAVAALVRPGLLKVGVPGSRRAVNPLEPDGATVRLPHGLKVDLVSLSHRGTAADDRATGPY